MRTTKDRLISSAVITSLALMPVASHAASGTFGSGYSWTTDIPKNQQYSTSKNPDYSYATGTTSSGGPCYGNADGSSSTCLQGMTRYLANNPANPLRDTSGNTVAGEHQAMSSSQTWGNFSSQYFIPASQYFSFLIDWKSNRGDMPTIYVGGGASFQLTAASATILSDGTSAAWVNVAAPTGSTFTTFSAGLFGVSNAAIALNIGSISYAAPGGTLSLSGAADVPEPSNIAGASLIGLAMASIVKLGRRKQR